MNTFVKLLAALLLLLLAAAPTWAADAPGRSAPASITATPPDTQTPVVSSAQPTMPAPPDQELRAHWNNAHNLKQITPNLVRHDGVYHAPAGAKTGGAATTIWNPALAGPISNVNFPNWSGVGVVGANNQYANGTIAYITTVPKSVAPLGTNCGTDSTFRATAMWAGFDGLMNSTVEQAGIWLTQQGCGAPNVGAFIEVYPNPEVTVSNFPIAPGDLITVFVSLNQANQSVCGYWENETQGVVTGWACLTAPGPFTASTTEWVVERPIYGSNYVPLTNYIAWPVWNGNVWGPTVYYAALAATPQDVGSTGTYYLMTMTDSSGTISFPGTRWKDTVIAHTAGDVYCNPSFSCLQAF